MKKVFVLLAIILCTAQVFAQNVITGKVTDVDDGPLPGVNVTAKGVVGVGTITDLEGAYSLEVPADAATLVFSFIGMKTQEVEINEQTLINATMESDDQNLDEVVVIAYGAEKKGSVTGAISVVTADKLTETPITSVDKALQGAAAGLVITSSSGNPNSTPNIRIRGTSSINSGNQPLFVVDGIPVVSGNFSSADNGNALAGINPNDIESISVLKDAGAMSLYGSRAANGVILITTKSGSANKVSYNFNAKYGFNQLPYTKWRKANAYEELVIKREGVANAGLNPSDIYPWSLIDERGNTDWFNEVYKRGVSQEYSLSASGGNEKTTFFTSISYTGDEGIVVGYDFKRIGARLNLTHKAGERVTLGLNTSFSRSESANGTEYGYGWENPVSSSPWMSALTPVRNADGTYNMNIPENGNLNPVGAADINTYETLSNKALLRSYLDIKIIEGLHIKAEAATDFNLIEDLKVYDPRITPWEVADNGTLYESKGTVVRYNLRGLINYDKTFAEKHNLSFLGGYELENQQWTYLNATSRNITIDKPYFMDGMNNESVYSNIDEYAMRSYLGRLKYNFDNKYYLEVSFRRDGHSRFGQNNRWGNFGSVSASWRISEENFMKGLDWVNDLKLRSSYGSSGNSSVGNYASKGVYEATSYYNLPATYPTGIQNDNLTWEKNIALNIGLDFSLINRISGTIEYYDRLTTDMLMEVPVSLTSGFDQANRNTAKMKNTGIEIELQGNVIRNSNLVWNVNANVAYNKNKITELPYNNRPILNGSTSYIVGKSAGIVTPIAYAGVDLATGQPLYWHIEYDENFNELSRQITNDLSNASREIFGNTYPRYTGALGTDISYKGFGLSAQFYFIKDVTIYTWGNRYINDDGRAISSGMSAQQLERWQKPGDHTSVPQNIYNNPTPGAWSSRWANDGSYLRLRDVSIWYDFSKKLLDPIKLSSLRLYVSGLNLYTWHKVQYFDPDIPASGGFFYPNPTSLVFGINIGF